MKIGASASAIWLTSARPPSESAKQRDPCRHRRLPLHRSREEGTRVRGVQRAKTESVAAAGRGQHRPPRLRPQGQGEQVRHHRPGNRPRRDRCDRGQNRRALRDENEADRQDHSRRDQYRPNSACACPRTGNGGLCMTAAWSVGVRPG